MEVPGVQLRGSYHPSVIYKSKREEKQLFDGNTALKTEEKNSESQENHRPDGIEGLLWDAEQFLAEAEKRLGEMNGYLEKLVQLNIQALNINLADADRVPLNRTFQSVKDELDKLAMSPIQGESIFSGRGNPKGKILPLSEDGEETIVIRPANRTSEGLGIRRSRIESLPSAKKATEHLARARVELKETVEAIASKVVAIGFKKRALEDARKLEQVSENKSNVHQKEERSGLYEVLRESQERAAEAKGRDFGLLVNIRV